MSTVAPYRKIQRYLRVGGNQSRALNSLPDPIRHFFFSTVQAPRNVFNGFLGGWTDRVDPSSSVLKQNQTLKSKSGPNRWNRRSPAGDIRLEQLVSKCPYDEGHGGVTRVTPWILRRWSLTVKTSPSQSSGLKSTASRFHF